MRLLLLSILMISMLACRQDRKLFQKLDVSESGIDFINTITETKAHNVFTYQYYYNGNGVAVGDVNDDGLTDVFITGNQTPSKLFLNKGDFHFEDITRQAGVMGKDAWKTGATMADVNGDGLLDIYVCYSGFGSEEERAEQLFINNGKNKEGIPTFTERAAEYGLESTGTYTSQAAFFDYDRDGDLDMFQLNHANEFYSPFFNTKRLRTLRHPQYGNRLYRNDGPLPAPSRPPPVGEEKESASRPTPPPPEGVGGRPVHFTDVSDSAGIFGGGNNFGLGIAISDIDNDGWPDVLVSNDFHEQDYLYLNNRNGTFREVCQQVFAHMSRNTMGLDIADFNNDLLPDVITLDMLPEDNYRQKILQGPDEYDKYSLMVDSGYGRQYNRNMLQLNRGFTKEGLPVFSEIGQFSGVSNTDWSWASLFADFDNDGFKDLFVTNGYLRESTNLDFMRYEVAVELERARAKGLDVTTTQGYMNNMPLYDLVKRMPSTKISNYMFSNDGDLTFSNQTGNWGLDEPGVSSGATYADLDNDGDLDLIVCNNNDPVWTYRNNANELTGNNYLKVKLTGDQKNLFGIGAKVIVTTASGEQMQEMYPVRGYQSSVDYVLNFGLGKQTAVRQVKVLWSADMATTINHPNINSTIEIKKKDAVNATATVTAQTGLFADITASTNIDFIQKENKYTDFKREFLIPYELSKQGPKMATADVNGDGLEDIFIGAPARQNGVLYLQTSEGHFRQSLSQPWQADAISEDVNAIFFDADNDHDADLYVVSGGSEWVIPGEELQDRLYINDGKGNFTKAVNVLPTEVISGTCVTANDFDKDGDLDLFVGASAIPGHYPVSAGNMVWRNDLDQSTGQLKFTDITETISGDDLFKAGMVSDAVWTDIDNDGWNDLILAGAWMPVTIFHNEQGKKLVDITARSGLDKTNGWWCKLFPADIDHDGDMDLIAGNMGLNTQFRTNEQQPLITYAFDFDNNGKLDPIMTWYVQGVSYPFNSRDEITGQLPVLNKKFLRYADYGKATINELFTEEQLSKARKFFIYHTETCLLINNAGKFELKTLPGETQFSPVTSLLYKDYDGDGKEDIFLCGNFYPFRVQQGQCDAGIGSLLKGDGKGNFTPLDRRQTGLYIPGDVRDMVQLNNGVILVSKNNSGVQVLKATQHE